MSPDTLLILTLIYMLVFLGGIAAVGVFLIWLWFRMDQFHKFIRGK